MATMDSSNNCAVWIIGQFANILFLIFKLKAWRAIWFAVPVTLAFSSMYVAKFINYVRTESDTKILAKTDGEVLFYAMSQFLSSKQRVLIDRSTFPVETNALISIVNDRGGGDTNWLVDCKSDSDCSTQLINTKDPSIVAYFRYSKNPYNRSNLECKFEDGPTGLHSASSFRCAFLYQLMAQSMFKDRVRDSVFKDVQFFTMDLTRYHKHDSCLHRRVFTAKTKSPTKTVLPPSVCSDWIDKGFLTFRNHFDEVLKLSMTLVSLGLVFYMMISTVSCIRTLKTSGFFQMLVRDGLSPACFWIVIWVVTVVECAVITGIYVLGHVLNCPGIYSTESMSKVFLFLLFYLLCFMALMLLLEMLIDSMAALCILVTGAAAGIVKLHENYNTIETRAPFLSYVIPLLSAKNYTAAYMFSDVVFKMTGSRLSKVEDFYPLEKMTSFYETHLTAMIIVPVLLVILIQFLDYLLPTGNGLLLPPYFLFSPRFWSPNRPQGHGRESTEVEQEIESHIEPVVGLSASVKASKVCKAFKGCCPCSHGLTVLNELSCTIYLGQITALIGHNGAGKSTLIKIITGEEIPDSGAAYIDGVKATDSIERLTLRGCITICPQFDSLCGELTVIETIRVTLKCKGACDATQIADARDMLKRLGLGDKENVRSTDLSGGQKRKVNTILTLLGDPKVVFLDEPTSGLDPVSRRQVWQLLQEKKLGRSILLCTQFMDEADVLADRKIFLCGGQIVCAGSSLFLKRAFECSFTLNVSLKSKSDAPKLISRLRQLELKSQFETELQLEVPAFKSDLLVEAVQVLESSQDIAAFGVSQANLDDIFMKLSGVSSSEIIDAFRSGEVAKILNKGRRNGVASNSADLIRSLGQSQCVHASHFRQFSALLRTNIKRTVRTVSSIFQRFVLPLIILLALGQQVIYEEFFRAKDEKSYDIIPPRMLSAGIHKPLPEIRLGIYYGSYPFICVYDDTDRQMQNESCASLSTYTEYIGDAVKPASVSLNKFMEQNVTFDEKLSSLCKRYGCIVYYASSWNVTQPNSNRSISIGFLDASGVDDTVHLFSNAFSLISIVFDTGDVKTTTALSHLKPYNEYQYKNEDIGYMLIIFCLFPVSYLSDPIEDMRSRVRSHLFSMGMNHLAYWVNTFIMHWIQYIVCFSISVGLLCLQVQLRDYFFITMCLPLLFLGTASNQLTIYAIAVITKTRSIVILVCCCLLAFILPAFVEKIGLTHMEVLVILTWLLPPVAPMTFIYNILMYSSYNQEYYYVDRGSKVPGIYTGCLTNPVILQALIAMPIHIGILCCIIALAENRESLDKLCFRKKQIMDSEKSVGAMDTGAQKEADRVLQSVRNAKNVLEVRQLCKTYPNGVKAVRGVTFGTLTAEIFGLLGANGAGKTSSMSVIVGEESPTGGECEVRVKDGTWVSGNRGASIGAIGYCPQHNPLFDTVTVAEHLELYADIRGVPSGAVAERQVTALIQGLGLLPHRDKYAEQLSGGNKRRLCLAIALLGDPALLVIDEASTGVDPENKRFIWDAIRGMLHDQRSVMVTTHSMEEVEALCSRIGIMNKGRMIALGTVQQLRSLYGTAYTLDILVKQDTQEKTTQRKMAVKGAISSQFKGSHLVEDLSLCMQFYVPKESVGRLSNALQWLTANQSRLGVDYFAFYQMSLDQVFVRLVKQCDDV